MAKMERGSKKGAKPSTEQRAKKPGEVRPAVRPMERKGPEKKS